MSVKTGYCTKPCKGCPWRMDTAMTILPVAERICGSNDRPIMPGEPMMPCHKKPLDADQNLCAAWLALYGWHHLGVRIMVGRGTIPASALEVDPDWPPLHPDVASIIEAHGNPNDNQEDTVTDEAQPIEVENGTIEFASSPEHVNVIASDGESTVELRLAADEKDRLVLDLRDDVEVNVETNDGVIAWEPRRGLYVEDYGSGDSFYLVIAPEDRMTVASSLRDTPVGA